MLLDEIIAYAGQSRKQQPRWLQKYFPEIYKDMIARIEKAKEEGYDENASGLVHPVMTEIMNEVVELVNQLPKTPTKYID